jgi:putative hydrolase of the HAD superfamily
MPLYTSAKHRFFDLMAKQGFDATRVKEEFEARDLRNVATWGFTVERFRRSMVETFDEFVRQKGEVPTLKVAESVSRIATAVARNKTRRMPDALAVLRRLQGQCRMVLLTKGEYALQERRVSESGFAEFFERVLIVDHKDKATFERVKVELRARVASTWSIGDSFRSDVRPALQVGLNAVWIPQETWGYETAEPEKHRRLLQLGSIGELPNALKKVGALK